MQIIMNPHVFWVFTVVRMLHRAMMAVKGFSNIPHISLLAEVRDMLPLVSPILRHETAKFRNLAIIRRIVRTTTHTFVQINQFASCFLGCKYDVLRSNATKLALRRHFVTVTILRHLIEILQPYLAMACVAATH